jgi:SAM-dependent methyltransferase
MTPLGAAVIVALSARFQGQEPVPPMGRMPIPRPLKARLLPVWNTGHRLAWRLGEYVGAVVHRRFERCAVCGRFGPMLYRRGVIPPKLEAMWGLSPRVAEALARKESLECWSCGAKLRARRLARVMLDLYPVGDPPSPARSVRAWATTPAARALRVAEINRIDGLHGELLRLPFLAWSDFTEGEPGPDAPRSEDLTRLSYPDESFDLVLTSETLEHVPDLDAALGQILRVLRPGGRHIFTVPLLPGVVRTHRRTDRLCHPGGDAGYPVITEFGADLPVILEAAGYETDLRFGPITEDDVAQVWVARKPKVRS